MTNDTVVMSAQDVFGPNPWLKNPTGSSPAGPFTLNPQYFATQQTAIAVAAMVGGLASAVDLFAEVPGNLVKGDQPTWMVYLASGVRLNAGLIAEFFAHAGSAPGYTLGQIQQMIVNEIVNASKEQLGLTVDPATVLVKMPSPPVAAPTTPVGFGAFGNVIPMTNGNSYTMLNPVLGFNGLTNVQINVKSPDGRVYLGVVRPPSPLAVNTPEPIGTWVAQS